MRHAAENPIWLPVYAKEKNMLLDIVSGKYAEVPAEQFEKMDVLRQDFLNQKKKIRLICFFSKLVYLTV